MIGTGGLLHGTRRGGAVRPSSEGLRHAVRLTAKEAIWWATARHVQGPKRNIFIFATHRGGSTWLLQVLESQPGVRSLNEPFSVFKAGSLAALKLPSTEGRHLVSLDTPGSEEMVRAYTADLLTGRSAAGAPYRPWKSGYTFKSNRIVIKDLHTKALIDWFDLGFDLDIVYLTRHPIPQALSQARLKWGLPARGYLRNARFTERLGPALTEEAWRILSEGTALERAVVSWVLENYVPLQLLPDRPAWTFVSYEACVSEPSATLRRLSQRLQVEDTDAMHAALSVPSRSSVMSLGATRTAITRGRSDELLGRWRSEVSSETEQSLLAILERFGVPLYVVGQDMPRPWWQ